MVEVSGRGQISFEVGDENESEDRVTVTATYRVRGTLAIVRYMRDEYDSMSSCMKPDCKQGVSKWMGMVDGGVKGGKRR